MVRGRLDSLAIGVQAHHGCTHRSTIARKHSTFQLSSHQHMHHPHSVHKNEMCCEGSTIYLHRPLSGGQHRWYGMSRSRFVSSDQYPNILGGHIDSCSFRGSGDQKFTWHNSNLESYYSDWKDSHGCSGSGGTACGLQTSKCKEQWTIRFWAQ